MTLAGYLTLDDCQKRSMTPTLKSLFWLRGVDRGTKGGYHYTIMGAYIHRLQPRMRSMKAEKMHFLCIEYIRKNACVHSMQLSCIYRETLSEENLTKQILRQ
jgi:hypothetical protein